MYGVTQNYVNSLFFIFFALLLVNTDYCHLCLSLKQSEKGKKISLSD